MPRETIPQELQDFVSILVAKQFDPLVPDVNDFYPLRLSPNESGALFVATSNSSIVFSNDQIIITNVSQQFLPENESRQYLFIQNNDALGNLFVSFTNAATLLNGIKIPPGSSYELNKVIPSNSINIIGDIASNANVVLVTG